MSKPLDQLTKTLKDNGYSLTEPRKVVFEALQDSEPLAMRQLVRACMAIHQTSVYRAVDLFIKLGIIQKLQIGWKYKVELSDQFREHHHHLTCLRCGKIIPFEEDEKLQRYLQITARKHNFEMREHVLEIQGLCSSCRPQYV